MNIVNSILGTELNQGVELAILFAALVLALVICVWGVRKLFGNKISKLSSKKRQPRLAVTDAAIVDDKRRLVLVRRDNVEHLILIGGQSDVLLEANISRVAPVAMPNAQTQTSKDQPKVVSQKSVPKSEAAPKTIPADKPKSGFGFSSKAKEVKSNIGSATGAVGAATATSSIATIGTQAKDALANKANEISADINAQVAKVSGDINKDIGVSKAGNASADADRNTSKAKVEKEIDALSVDLEKALDKNAESSKGDISVDSETKKILDELSGKTK